MLGVVIQVDGYDPVAEAAVTLRAGSHDDAAVCHLGGEIWWPALVKLPTLRYDLFDGAFGGQITAPSSSLKLAVDVWPDFGRYALADARLRLWTGEVGQAWAQWTLRFDGLVTEQPETEDGLADVSFAVDDRWLDNALLATYAGTAGAEGGADLKGQPKPLALGAPRYVAGTLIDAVNSVFQVSGYGPVVSFDAALERLARFGAPVGDFASHAALVAANIPAGRWASARAVGMARLGAPPTGQVSFLVSGDTAGPDGWARKPGQLIRRLALLSGGAGKIHDASLNALDGLRPYNLSLYIDQQTTARQLIQQLAASVNAVAGMSWTGQLFVVPVAIGAATVTLAADGSALPPVGSVKQIGIASPFKKLAIGAERAWTVHPLADIAFAAELVEVGTWSATTTYREGNIVSLADGSRWVYIATAAGAGVMPAEGAVWSSLSAAVQAAYADGTPIEKLKPATPGATDGAPAGSNIGGTINPDGSVTGGKPAEEVLADARLLADSVIDGALRQDEAREVQAARDFHQGQPVKLILLNFKNQQETVNTAVNSFLTLMGAQTADGTAVIIDLDTVRVSPTQTLGQKLTEVSASNEELVADVQQLLEAVVEPDGTGKARFLLSGVVAGNQVMIEGLANNDGSYLNFVASRFRFLDSNGNNPVQVLEYKNNRWEFTVDVYAKRLVADTVEASNIKASAVAQFAFATLTSDVTLYGGASASIFYLGFTKQESNSLVRIQAILNARSVDDLQLVSTITMSSVDGSINRTRTFRLNNPFSERASSAQGQISEIAHFDLLPAGNYTVTVTVTNNESSGDTLFIETDSAIEIEEKKRAAF